MMNSVGFYQIAKLLIIPFTAVVEALWLGEWLTMSQTACTALVVAGVAVVYAPLAFFMTTLAMLNIEPPEPKNSGSNADDPINLAHLLGMLHIVDLIC
jgi:hypothetical protein